MSEILVHVVPKVGGNDGNLYGRSTYEKLLNRVDELGDSILAVAHNLGRRLTMEPGERSAGWRLEQVELTFSLELQADAGVIVSQVSTGAGFEVAMSWSRSAAPATAVQQ